MFILYDNNVRRPVVSSYLHGNCLQMKILAPNEKRVKMTSSHENTRTSTHEQRIGVWHSSLKAEESGLEFPVFLRSISTDPFPDKRVSYNRY